ncbi:thermonuclease family protein [Variovorax ureilyticus]|uniref:Thermonuclease family protein n=1 Tax=Variovorax ureilyticus TaxID=1836198 RepID=A0ABU8VK40_9BURK
MRRLLFWLLVALPFALHATPQTCLIVGVPDGDTLKARCGQPGSYEEIKVRLNGIDAPEKRQAFGERAKQAMSDLVYMKDAELDCRKIDRYGRSVCRVMVPAQSAPNGPKTLDAGLAMVTVGVAWWYRAYAKEQTPQERGQYEYAETEARAKRVGLWRDAEPVPPWEWRKAQRDH